MYHFAGITPLGTYWTGYLTFRAQTGGRGCGPRGGEGYLTQEVKSAYQPSGPFGW